MRICCVVAKQIYLSVAMVPINIILNYGCWYNEWINCVNKWFWRRKEKKISRRKEISGVVWSFVLKNVSVYKCWYTKYHALLIVFVIVNECILFRWYLRICRSCRMWVGYFFLLSFFLVIKINCELLNKYESFAVNYFETRTLAIHTLRGTYLHQQQ